MCSRCRSSAPSPSPHANRACMRTGCLGRAVCSPEPKLPRPPPDHHRRARPSAGSPNPGTHLAPSIGHLEALCAAHCPAPPVPSPDFTPPRPYCPCPAAAAHRRHHRSCHHRQLVTGETNHSLGPFVCQLGSSLAGGEVSPAAEGSCVRAKVL
jgi:hypothetical protein